MRQTELIPVIHVLDETQVLKNLEVCLANGVGKVFLINHAVSDIELLAVAAGVRKEFPELWIGVNMLGVRVENAVNMLLPGIDGLWCDGTLSPESAASCRRFEGMFFGGLAFKYQPQPHDLELACADAQRATDVATTSGAGTGVAAEVEKILRLREYLGEHPMAIASGVSVENVGNYKGVTDYLLVATSITGPGEILLNEKLAELMSELDR